ncbi:MAG: cytochrome c biogenesis protein CcdA [Rhodospirillales bacterium]|nr:cytochrome c biogenesis protein CcdA [Rhodospirillales bacterium]MBO6788685.1 cytochrome c biogenesis protein CcdA [Rhodospirillales bacterium]
MAGFDVGFAGAFIAGLLSFFSPCILPLVPPYLCFIGGVSIAEMTDEAGPPPGANWRVFFAALTFVVGFSLVFILFGATASFLGQLLAENMLWVSRVAGVLIIIMGVHFLGIVKIPLLYREARFQGPAKPVGLFGAFLMGLAFAFGWTPCVGPVLAAILMMAGSEESITSGTLLLGSYAAGIGIPFLIAALGINPFLQVMPGIRRHMGTIEKVIGVFLIATGVLFLTGSIADIAYWLLETFPVLGKVG